jgi:hypothetical protein
VTLTCVWNKNFSSSEWILNCEFLILGHKCMWYCFKSFKILEVGTCMQPMTQLNVMSRSWEGQILVTIFVFHEFHVIMSRLIDSLIGLLKRIFLLSCYSNHNPTIFLHGTKHATRFCAHLTFSRLEFLFHFSEKVFLYFYFPSFPFKWTTKKFYVFCWFLPAGAKILQSKHKKLLSQSRFSCSSTTSFIHLNELLRRKYVWKKNQEQKQVKRHDEEIRKYLEGF